MRQWSHVMVHHSLTKDSGTVSWPAVKRYHMQTMGMKDIGYHFGVELTGTDYEALIGRSLEMDGAGCPQGDMNKIAIHVLFMGALDKAPPPAEQVEVFRDRIWKPMSDLFSIPPTNIVFHREFAPWKSCPGTAFTMKYLSQFIPGVRA